MTLFGAEDSRVTARAGVVIIKAREYYDDDLAHCIRFSSIEDRTAADNPSWGYFVFRVAAGEKKVPPQAVRHIFFFDDLNPSDLVPGKSDSTYSLLLAELREASQLNSTIASVLAPFVNGVENITARLAAGQQLRKGAWLTKEDLALEKEKAELAEVRGMAEKIRANTVTAESANDISALRSALRSLDAYQSSNERVLALKKQSIAALSAEIKTSSEQIELKEASAELRANMEGHGFPSVQQLADAAANLKSLMPKIGALSEDAQLLASSESLLAKAGQMMGDLRGWHVELGSFLALADRNANELSKLPSLDLPTSVWKNKYSEFKTGSSSSFPGKFADLQTSADRLFGAIDQYLDLRNSSSSERTLYVIQNPSRFSIVLDLLPGLKTRLQEMNQRYANLIADAKMEESQRNFGAAQKKYQEAYKLAPSEEILHKIEYVSSQNLGL